MGYKSFPFHHAIIYTGAQAPEPLSAHDGDDLLAMPIRVIPNRPSDTFSSQSRINLAKPYTVEHNVKVYDFGRVDTKDFWKLIDQFEDNLYLQSNAVDYASLSRSSSVSENGRWRVNQRELTTQLKDIGAQFSNMKEDEKEGRERVIREEDEEQQSYSKVRIHIAVQSKTPTKLHMRQPNRQKSGSDRTKDRGDSIEGKAEDDSYIYFKTSIATRQMKEMYILEFAQDLSIHLPSTSEEVDHQALAKFYFDLPQLLQSFARKIGHLDNSAVSREVMVFVSQYRQYVFRMSFPVQ